MHKGRMEAFSDGVIAIIITIMVLEMKIPVGAEWSALRPITPIFFSYVLSYIYLGIYWNNHHHMLQAAQRVNGWILWANLNLLFWLSLLPFVTGWMGSNNFAPLPVALYGVVLLMAAIGYFFLAHSLARHHGPDSHLARVLGRDVKGKVSIAIYAAAVPLSWVNPWIAFTMYSAVAAMWFIPDRRIESTLGE